MVLLVTISLTGVRSPGDSLAAPSSSSARIATIAATSSGVASRTTTDMPPFRVAPVPARAGCEYGTEGSQHGVEPTAAVDVTDQMTDRADADAQERDDDRDGAPRHSGDSTEAVTTDHDVEAEHDVAVPPAPDAVPAVGSERDAHLDNVKLVAIALVVVGHSWEPMLAWSHTLRAAYMFAYTIHMPVFTLLSGYFSRHFTASPRQARSLVRSIVVPYLIIESAFTLFRHFGNGEHLHFAFYEPWWLTWFLMTLFFWRLSAPVWRVVRFPIVIAVVAALAAGSRDLPRAFEMTRLLEYLPFFVIGMSLRKQHFAWLRTLWVRVAAVPVLLGAMYVAYLLAPHASLEWVYWRASAHQMGMDYLPWAGIKLLQLAVTLLVVFAVVAVVPGRRLPVVTTFGAASIFAYLLHGFVVKGATWWGLYDLPFLHTGLGIATVGVAGVVLMLVLCSPPVRVLFGWAVQPRLDGWLRGSRGPLSRTE